MTGLKIETLRWVLPVVVGAIIPFFFLLIYLGSCRSRIRLLHQQGVAQLQLLQESLRARVALAARLVHELRARSLGESAELSRLEKDAQLLESLLKAENAASSLDGPGGSVRRVMQASREFEESLRLLSLADPSAIPASQGDAPSLSELHENRVAWLAAVTRYNQSVERYQQGRTAFPGRFLVSGAEREPLEQFVIGG